MKSKVVVGMSGGVDSSVTAALLVEQGYGVKGVFIEAYNEPGCRTDDDRRDALRVANELAIPFEVWEMKKEYEKRVVKYFYEEYREGRTPNPDIVCNSQVKFGFFLEKVLNQGYDYVATGHYASKSIEGLLTRPKDLSKDQSYFLWQVEPAVLTKVLFPLAQLYKGEVRAKAKELGLPNAEKPDSMGVCMMGQLSVREFLKSKLGEKPGEVVWNGEVVGEHGGLWFYTIGQRGGWQVKAQAQQAEMPALYVVEKKAESNQLIVGEKSEAMARVVELDEVKEYRDFSKSKQLYLRVRNLGEMYRIANLDYRTRQLRVETDESLFAPAPGQSGVIYDELGQVVGGGIIK